MRKVMKTFAAFCGAVAFLMLGASIVVAKELPNSYSVVEGQRLSFSGNLPLVATAGGSVAADANTRAGLAYQSDVKLFGVVEVKHVSVSVVKATSVIPGGEVFGVKLYTQGVMVIGMSDVDTATGPKNPSYNAGIRKGDILLAINGKTVNSNDEVAQAFSDSNGKTLDISVKRGSVGFTAAVKPALSVSEKAYKAGIWVRDSTAGIGTVTFYNPASGSFGGLGHGICDVDTGEILPLLKGEAVKADITDVLKSSSGRTGELEGTLEDNTLGSLLLNQQTGVFGFLNSDAPTGKSIPVAMCQQIHRGPAKILSTVDDGAPRAYEIQIESVNYDNDVPTKNMVIRITDPVLIAKTGGIVQGMSGSPIIQDGRLIGAVTHVFVNDPLRGYGIFAENMINTAKTLENGYATDVS